MAPSVARAARVVGASANLVANVIHNLDRLLGNVDQLVAEVTFDANKLAAESQALYQLALARAVSVRDAIRATPRFTRILTEVARVAAAYKLRSPARDLDALHRESAERLYALCVELRGGVLKVGQFASSRLDLLPAAYVESLSRLQDRVPAVPTSAIRARVEAELGRPIAELFAAFDDEPMAAASLAQVHGATLLDGTRVAVKIQLPGIEEVVETDLAALRILAAALRETVPQVDLTTIATELTRSVREELDYEAEAGHAEAVRASFAGDPTVIVPFVRADLSTARVLVLERIDGARLVDWLEAADPAARDRLLEILVRSTCAQILAHGRFQGDAHPGNYLVLDGEDGPRLALLDFGCVQVLTPEERAAYAGLALAILSRDARQMAERFATLGFATRTGDPAALTDLADMILGAFRDNADLSAIDPRAQMEQAMAILRANPVVSIPHSFVLLGRVFATLGGLLMKYRPKINLFAIIGPHLR